MAAYLKTVGVVQASYVIRKVRCRAAAVVRSKEADANGVESSSSTRNASPT